MLPRDAVRLESALVGELGAESIDFLDLIFRIEEVVGTKIPARRWEEFVRAQLPGADLTAAITVAMVVAFARHERDRELHPERITTTTRTTATD